MKQERLAHLAAALALREASHRRATLLAISALLLSSTSPVFGHHLPLGLDALLAGVDHLGTLCLAALRILFTPVHWIFHIILVAGVLYAMWDRVTAWRHVRRVLAPLDTRAPRRGDVWWSAAVAAGLDAGRVRIVRGLPSPAFTVGLWTPTVYVAAALAGRLSDEQLAAVLAHERAHVERRDPLRLSLLRAMACTLFWIPALRRLADDMSDEAEVLADDAAAEGRPLVLASAILALARWPHAPVMVESVAGFYRRELLERRIRRLAGEAPPVASHLTRRSIAGAGLALALVWSSGMLMARPLPASAPGALERHCDHRHESALAHLFCRSPFARASEPCPHQHE